MVTGSCVGTFEIRKDLTVLGFLTATLDGDHSSLQLDDGTVHSVNVRMK